MKPEYGSVFVGEKSQTGSCKAQQQGLAEGQGRPLDADKSIAEQRDKKRENRMRNVENMRKCNQKGDQQREQGGRFVRNPVVVR